MPVQAEYVRTVPAGAGEPKTLTKNVNWRCGSAGPGAPVSNNSLQSLHNDMLEVQLTLHVIMRLLPSAFSLGGIGQTSPGMWLGVHKTVALGHYPPLSSQLHTFIHVIKPTDMSCDLSLRGRLPQLFRTTTLNP